MISLLLHLISCGISRLASKIKKMVPKNSTLSLLRPNSSSRNASSFLTRTVQSIQMLYNYQMVKMMEISMMKKMMMS